MVEKAKKKLTCTRDEYTPPNGWTREPDAFNGLKLDMPKAEAEKRVSFGNCTVTTTEIPDFPTRENFLYETTLNVGGLAIPGEVLFIENRLINLGGKFDRSLWDVIKTAFIDLYGRPHVDERNEIFEQGLSRRLEWQGDRVRIGLLDFPDGTDLARFYYSQTLKGAKLRIALAHAKSVPPPEPPKIVVEHSPSMLILRLPDGTTLDYARSDPAQIALKSTWHRGDDGRFVYDLELDASMLARIGIGDGGGCVDRDAVVSQPEGWHWMWSGWEGSTGESDVSASGKIARFSITSAMLPGPMPINLVRKDVQQSHAGWSITLPPWPISVTLPRRLYDAALKTLTQHATFLNNTFIIGPAIAPNSTEADLRQLIQTWIDHYGFDFLKPALHENGALSTELDQLKSSTDFERQIIDCLRAAL
jgi:hypothetical protein